MIKVFLRKLKVKRSIKRNKEVVKDINRGKAVLELIDNHLMTSKTTRKQRKQFWREFIHNQNVRSHMYSTIEKALEGETKYKERKLL